MHRNELSYSRTALVIVAVFAAVLAGCAPAFQPAKFGSNQALFDATLREFNREHWDNAVSGFEKLSLDLPTRDPLLPRVLYYLGQAHAKRGEQLLAAQTYARLVDAFPDDSVAPVAMFATGQAYQKLWRKPTLDAEYGQRAQAVYRNLIGAYPQSPYAKSAEDQLHRLDEWFATKDYETALHYLRRKGYDPAIIYLKDVIRQYPAAAKTRDAYLKLVDAYRAIHYKEEAAEACVDMRRLYADDRAVKTACGAAPATAVPSAAAVPVPPTPGAPPTAPPTTPVRPPSTAPR